MVETAKRFKFGWFGDGGLGERLIQAILSGRKTATSCPAYDPEDAELLVGDKLDLVDKHGRSRGTLVVTRVELRPFGGFDEALAAAEGTTLHELLEATRFANGRQLRPDEEMRVIHFQLVQTSRVKL
jgi:uncharacterized protein YhfF